MAMYKTGQYIARKDTISLLVVAALGKVDPPLADPLYALRCTVAGKDNRIIWFTQYELDNHGFYEIKPVFDKWANIKTGDMVETGGAYKKVLARFGDIVLLSTQPADKKGIKVAHKLSEQLDELTNGQANFVENLEKQLERDKPFLSSNGALKVAENHWHHIHDLALMNWELLRE